MSEPNKLDQTLKVHVGGDRGVFAGGNTTGSPTNVNTNIIDYITISSAGNATDFGDLLNSKRTATGTSNGNNNRGVFGGGYTNTYLNVIEYITIRSFSNSADFGDLTLARQSSGACSNATNERGVWAGGYTGTFQNVIDYITISSTGNASDFGDLLATRYLIAGCSNGTNERGIFGGGGIAVASNIIYYITISTPSNATDFGDLSVANLAPASCSNGVSERGVFSGGEGSGGVPMYNIIEYITINSTGNTTDFGDQLVERGRAAGISNDTDNRGVTGGGETSQVPNNIIDYITINSTGNSTDFGDLTVGRYNPAGASDGSMNVEPISIYDSTCTIDATACMQYYLSIKTLSSESTGERGIFGGGSGSPNVISYVTINSAGNATDFGDLITGRNALSATSNGSHDRGLFNSGRTTVAVNIIEYITISEPGNSINFGDLTVARYGTASCSNASNQRGICSGGYTTTYNNTIDYITISSTGNAIDFGNLTLSRYYLAGTSNANNERGVFAGGWATNNRIDYIAINSPSNATDFGDLLGNRYELAACSNGTNERGVIAAGTNLNVIEYITINSPGNSSDFGDFSINRRLLASTSNGVQERGIFGGGGSSGTNVIEYVTINSAGNATDFGDLTTSPYGLSATSNASFTTVTGYIQLTHRTDDPEISHLKIFQNNTTLSVLKNFSELGMLMGDIGVFGGGMDSIAEECNIIDYITITSTGNATDFGDLLTIRNDMGCTSNGANQRGVFIAGCGQFTYNYIDYITINSTSNSTNFGIATQRVMFIAASSNGTNERGIFGGGTPLVGGVTNVIEYITINSPSNGTDFGDLTVNRTEIGGTSNATNERGIFAGGQPVGGGQSNVIDYVTISSTGNATDFGDLTIEKYYLTGCSNGTNQRGVFGGAYIAGSGSLNVIDYITINSTGNATDFGDLLTNNYSMASTSNATNERGIFAGGNIPASTNVIQYITINSTNNTTDFGDLAEPRSQFAGTSNC